MNSNRGLAPSAAVRETLLTIIILQELDILLSGPDLGNLLAQLLRCLLQLC